MLAVRPGDSLFPNPCGFEAWVAALCRRGSRQSARRQRTSKSSCPRFGTDVPNPCSRPFLSSVRMPAGCDGMTTGSTSLTFFRLAQILLEESDSRPSKVPVPEAGCNVMLPGSFRNSRCMRSNNAVLAMAGGGRAGRAASFASWQEGHHESRQEHAWLCSMFRLRLKELGELEAARLGLLCFPCPATSKSSRELAHVIHNPGKEPLHAGLARSHRSCLGPPLLREPLVRLEACIQISIPRLPLAMSGQVIHHLVRYGVAEAAVKLTIHFANLSLQSAAGQHWCCRAFQRSVDLDRFLKRFVPDAAGRCLKLQADLVCRIVFIVQPSCSHEGLAGLHGPSER